MYKRTVIAIAFSLACWGSLQAIVLTPGSLRHSGFIGSSMPATLASAVHAQSDDSADDVDAPATIAITSTVSPTSTGSLTEALSSKLAQNLTDTTPISSTPGITATDILTPTVDAETGADEADSEAPPVEAELPPGQADLNEENPVLGIVEGTILANRTTVTAKFFVEGQIQELVGLRSTGLELARSSSVLNLYNCDAAIPETDEGCFWDPYMIDRDGFYEIVASDATDTPNLTLTEAGGPSGAAIWIQNQSPQPELVVYRNNTFDLLPGALREFAVGEDALPTFFVRSCVEIDDAAACEWIPVVANSGLRYALVEIETASGLPGGRVSMLDLLPLDADGEVIVEESQPQPVEAATLENAAAAPAAPPGPQFSCTLLVPTLNVRSGPGLEYEIVAKVRGSEAEAATVLIVGRDETSQWLAVDELVAPGGWITGIANFVACDGAIAGLAIAEITDGRLAPTPVAETEAPLADGTAPSDAAAGTAEGTDATSEAAEATAASPEVPKGQGLLLVNNGFDQDLRFTLDQKYRVEPGPSEYDLKPGQSTQIFVYPGLVGFSASTAWRGLSDNTDFFIEEEETRALWLFFMPDPDGSGRWILQY